MKEKIEEKKLKLSHVGLESPDQNSDPKKSGFNPGPILYFSHPVRSRTTPKSGLTRILPSLQTPNHWVTKDKPQRLSIFFHSNNFLREKSTIKERFKHKDLKLKRSTPR